MIPVSTPYILGRKGGKDFNGAIFESVRRTVYREFKMVAMIAVWWVNACISGCRLDYNSLLKAKFNVGYLRSCTVVQQTRELSVVSDVCVSEINLQCPSLTGSRY